MRVKGEEEMGEEKVRGTERGKGEGRGVKGGETRVY